MNQAQQCFTFCWCAWMINPIPNHMPTLSCVYQASQFIIMMIYARFQCTVRLQHCSMQARESLIVVMMHYDNGKSTLERTVSMQLHCGFPQTSLPERFKNEIVVLPSISSRTTTSFLRHWSFLLNTPFEEMPNIN